jgi:hypothetical protein
MLPEHQTDVKEKFESAIDRAARPLPKAAMRFRNLRASTVVTNDLAVAISTLGDELAASAVNGNGTVAHVAVQGASGTCIRSSATTSTGLLAKRCATPSATRTRVGLKEITTDDRQSGCRVRDDGKAWTRRYWRRPAWTLACPGMRERAGSDRRPPDVWSEVGAGTEIDLTIPAGMVYVASRARRRAWWFGKKTVTNACAPTPLRFASSSSTTIPCCERGSPRSSEVRRT